MGQVNLFWPPFLTSLTALLDNQQPMALTLHTPSPAAQMYLAEKAPFLLTEAGTHWTDMVATRRIAAGSPTSVLSLESIAAAMRNASDPRLQSLCQGCGDVRCCGEWLQQHFLPPRVRRRLNPHARGHRGDAHFSGSGLPL